jgi:hypothetical protein
MATKKITELSQIDPVSSNLSQTFLVVVDTSGGSPITKKASLTQIDEAIEAELGQATSGAIYANAAFEVANTAFANPIMLEPLSGLTITEDFTIPNNYRGVSRGTVTIDSNVTVTISETAEWLIDN